MKGEMAINDDWEDNEDFSVERCPYCGTELYDSDGDLICPNLCEGDDNY